MTDSAMRRAVSRDGLATGAVAIGGDGRLGFPFPCRGSATTRGRAPARTAMARLARLGCGMQSGLPMRTLPASRSCDRRIVPEEGDDSKAPWRRRSHDPPHALAPVRLASKPDNPVPLLP